MKMIAEVGSPNKHEIKFESSCFIQYRIDGLEIQKQYNYKCCFMESLWTVYNVCVYMADVLSYFCCMCFYHNTCTF
jgi:hypothetical protein